MTGNKILLIGTFDPQFGRARQLVRLGNKAGFSLQLHPYQLWGADKVSAAQRSLATTALKMVSTNIRMALHAFRVGFTPSMRPSAFLVPHPSQIDGVIIGLIGRIVRVPVIIDYFVSLHETVVLDRQLASSRSLKASVLKAADRWSTRLASAVLADTPEDADDFSRTTRTPREKWHVVRVGADPEIYHRRPEIAQVPHSILFYGTYIPLQGIEHIVQASLLLPSHYRLTLLGDGQLRPQIEQLIEASKAPVQLLDSVPESELAHHISAAEVCLGVFGHGDKTQRVIPNKVYQCLAVGRAVITGDSPAIEVLGEAVVKVPVADPQALAAAIIALIENDDQRKKLEVLSYELFNNRFTDDHISLEFTQAFSFVAK